MSYFLWVEDFDNNAETTAKYVFGGLKDAGHLSGDKRKIKRDLKPEGIYIEFSFQDGLDFIQNKLGDIDYIILDIDLPAFAGSEPNKNVLALLEKWHGYQKQDDKSKDEELLGLSAKELRQIAGYYLYTELILKLGFPEHHILFCSNHGENVTSIREAFNSAKIELPSIHRKSDSEEIQEWIRTCYENSYSKLRRGIIEGCRYLKNLSEDKLLFKEFIKDPEKKLNLEDVQDYLDVLEKFLPLCNRENNDTTLYKLFIRILAHEWEAAEPKQLNSQKELYAFSWIMKMARNWLAHSKVFEQLTPQDVAYLFIVNMRAMFDLGDNLLPYEKHLLSLFTTAISVDEMKENVGIDHKTRKIPLIENYAVLLKKTGNTWQAINFHDALNNLQKNKDKQVDSDFFIEGLYQTFWFLTSTGGVYIPPDEEIIKRFSVLNYQFNYFGYQKEYIFELARHIYARSFLNR